MGRIRRLKQRQRQDKKRIKNKDKSKNSKIDPVWVFKAESYTPASLCISLSLSPPPYFTLFFNLYPSLCLSLCSMPPLSSISVCLFSQAVPPTYCLFPILLVQHPDLCLPQSEELLCETYNHPLHSIRQ